MTIPSFINISFFTQISYLNGQQIVMDIIMILSVWARVIVLVSVYCQVIQFKLLKFNNNGVNNTSRNIQKPTRLQYSIL